MLNKEKIDSYYKSGFWTKEMVASAVAKGKITAEQFQEITGEIYSAV